MGMVMVFISAGMRAPDFGTDQTRSSAEILKAMHGSGFIAQTLDSNSLHNSAILLRSKFVQNLQAGQDANIAVYSYYLDRGGCNLGKTFDACFPDANRSSAAAGANATGDFVSASQFYMGKNSGETYMYMIRYTVWRK